MKECTKCGECKELSFFHSDSSKKDGRYPTCTPCANAIRRARYAEAPEKTLDRNEKWRMANPGLVRAIAAKAYLENRDARLQRNAAWRQRNPEIVKRSTKEWAAKNPGRALAAQRRYRAKGGHNASNAARRAAIRNSVPKWLTEDQRENVGLYYGLAKDMSAFDGQKYDVDHIEPLIGKNAEGAHVSCGLHVPWNLQIMEHRSNCAKGCRI